jgi:nitrogen fixation protein NifZ
MAMRQPLFQWGQRVHTLADLYNDGSYPDQASDSLLAAQGSIGEIVQVGMHQESHTPIYLVEFGDGHVVGCFEEELQAVESKTTVPVDHG